MEKSKALQTVNDLPDHFELEELIERLIFIEKVEKGLEQVKSGKTISHESVKQEIKKW